MTPSILKPGIYTEFGCICDVKNFIGSTFGSDLKNYRCHMIGLSKNHQPVVGSKDAASEAIGFDFRPSVRSGGFSMRFYFSQSEQKKRQI